MQNHLTGDIIPIAITNSGNVLLAAGNVGIGTANPGQKLEVNGGMTLNTATAKPACSSTTRGTFWVTQGGAGVADSIEVCAKDATDAYAWAAIGGGSAAGSPCTSASYPNNKGVTMSLASTGARICCGADGNDGPYGSNSHYLWCEPYLAPLHVAMAAIVA